MLKSFRDSYATILILNGIVLKWTSLPLGHSGVAVTERHYMRWMTQDGYSKMTNSVMTRFV